MKAYQRLLISVTVIAPLLTIACISSTPGVPGAGTAYPVGPLEPVPAVRQRAEWNRFVILVWQWQNDVRRDGALYDLAGLRGFHIDRGAGGDDLVHLSLRRQFPYYVDHAAGKGALYLSANLRPQVTGKRSLLVRPVSLADPETIAGLKDQLRNNVATTKKGFVYAYAFDDEISLGSFNAPAEVDIHPLSLAWYRKWAASRYGTIQSLNEAWAAKYSTFEEVQPAGFEEIRRAASAPPIARWNLSRWMEWRHFMDYQFAQVLADLTRFTNRLDPKTPAGFVGGQQPSAYGGYDYSLLSRAVQWMEGSDEILRSFWNHPRRPRVLTYTTTGAIAKDTWNLWYRLAHGNQLTIAWPEGWMRNDPTTGKRELAAEVIALSAVFREVQGAVSEFIVDPDSFLEADPIGLYYSQPSIRASWVMDAITHGSTWPNRSSSMDDENLSSGWLRRSWGRLLEDLGYQYDFISYLDVQEGRIDLSRKFKVIILPQAVCLSDLEARALKTFVMEGGTLIADELCGLLTESGHGRNVGALDDLFGLERDEAKGYLNGGGLVEINAENYKQPFPSRLTAYDGALKHGALVVFERGTRAVGQATGETVGSAQVLIRNRPGRGQSIYLNMTPLAYDHFPFRSGEVGQQWRDVLGRILNQSGLQARVTVENSGGKEPWIETLLWRKGNLYCLAILKNLSGGPDKSSDDILRENIKSVRVRLNLPAAGIRNLRTGKAFGNATSFTDNLLPCEANLYFFSLR